MIGCGNPEASSVASDDHAVSDQTVIAEALAQLSPEDRLLAESQKYCAIANSNPLGTMGTPLKIEVNGESVFLCCSGCKGKATGDPEKTLASVAKLKAENSASK